MARQSPFAGRHTIRKLDAIEKYLRAYQRALSKTGFTTIFFDAFAGTGELPSEDQGATLFDGVTDRDEIVQGSAQRALRIKPPFARYIFIEKMRGKARDLQGMSKEFPEVAGRIEVIEGDANSELIRFCRTTNWKSARAVVFLDPFGNQVHWKRSPQSQAAQSIFGTYFRLISE